MNNIIAGGWSGTVPSLWMKEKKRNWEWVLIYCVLSGVGSADAPPTMNSLVLCLWMRAKLLIAFELIPIEINIFQDFSRAETFLLRCGTSPISIQFELRLQFPVMENNSNNERSDFPFYLFTSAIGNCFVTIRFGYLDFGHSLDTVFLCVGYWKELKHPIVWIRLKFIVRQLVLSLHRWTEPDEMLCETVPIYIGTQIDKFFYFEGYVCRKWCSLIQRCATSAIQAHKLEHSQVRDPRRGRQSNSPVHRIQIQ